MPCHDTPRHHAALRRLVQDSGWFMSALEAARTLALPCWCIGAGAVRTLVWDALHGYASPSRLADMDLVYFDAAEPPGRDQAHQQQLACSAPGFPWEVTNQAHVHLWLADRLGRAVAPLQGMQQAIASWPETATCVGVSLSGQGHVEIIAPCGLEDLFAMRMRHNPALASVAAFEERAASKRYAAHWPRVQIVRKPPSGKIQSGE